MWLRSEKRSSRLSRGDSSKTAVNLRKIIKSTPAIKALKSKCKVNPPPPVVITSRRHLHSSTSTIDPKVQPKCNKIKATVKRLGRKGRSDKLKTLAKASTGRTGRTGRNVRRKLSDPGKENCWQDSIQEEITLYAADVKVKGQTIDVEYNKNCSSIDGLSNDEALNNFGPIVLEGVVDGANSNNDGSAGCRGTCASCKEFNISAAICRIDKENNSRRFECSGFMKCISECDSTTDYVKRDDSGNLPSTSTSSVNPTNYYFKPLQEVVVPEVDSTTDLFPVVAQTKPTMADNDDGKQRLSASNANNTFHTFPTPELTPSIKHHTTATSQMSPIGANSSAGTATATNYPSTPDLISLFDEEINKGSTDMCQYTDFFPYNSVITQALLSCNEVSTLCEQTDLASNLQTDITFLSSINQTAIDNLKALTNLQNHTSNFLSGITLPKPSCSTSTMERGGTTSTDHLIHSVSATSTATATIYPHPQMMMHQQDGLNHATMVHHHHHQHHHQQQHEMVHEEGGDIQLETDECMEIEEIPERQEELAWDAFDPYVFIKHLPPLTAEMRAKCPALPLKTRSSPEFNLVLDLDETLVHCSLQELSDASFKFPVLFQVCPFILFTLLIFASLSCIYSQIYTKTIFL